MTRKESSAASDGDKRQEAADNSRAVIGCQPAFPERVVELLKELNIYMYLVVVVIVREARFCG